MVRQLMRFLLALRLEFSERVDFRRADCWHIKRGGQQAILGWVRGVQRVFMPGDVLEVTGMQPIADDQPARFTVWRHKNICAKGECWWLTTAPERPH